MTPHCRLWGSWFRDLVTKGLATKWIPGGSCNPKEAGFGLTD